MFVFTGSPCVLFYAEASQGLVPANVVKVGFQLTNGDSGLLVPLFTGLEFAEKFLILLGESGKGMSVFKIDSLDALSTALNGLKNSGVTHVVFNSTPGGNQPPIPIRDVIDSLSQRLRNMDDPD